MRFASPGVSLVTTVTVAAISLSSLTFAGKLHDFSFPDNAEGRAAEKDFRDRIKACDAKSPDPRAVCYHDILDANVEPAVSGVQNAVGSMTKQIAHMLGDRCENTPGPTVCTEYGDDGSCKKAQASGDFAIRDLVSAVQCYAKYLRVMRSDVAKLVQIRDFRSKTPEDLMKELDKRDHFAARILQEALGSAPYGEEEFDANILALDEWIGGITSSMAMSANAYMTLSIMKQACGLVCEISRSGEGWATLTYVDITEIELLEEPPLPGRGARLPVPVDPNAVTFEDDTLTGTPPAGATGVTGPGEQKGSGGLSDKGTGKGGGGKDDTHDPGKTGVSGQTGITGQSGQSGQSGVSGQSGQSGQSGISGQSGVSGETGQSGVTGETGQSGVTGETGQTGQSGQTGTTGRTGKTGPTGRGKLGKIGDKNAEKIDCSANGKKKASEEAKEKGMRKMHVRLHGEAVLYACMVREDYSGPTAKRPDAKEVPEAKFAARVALQSANAMKDGVGSLLIDKGPLREYYEWLDGELGRLENTKGVKTLGEIQDLHVLVQELLTKDDDTLLDASSSTGEYGEKLNTKMCDWMAAAEKVHRGVTRKFPPTIVVCPAR